MKRGGEERMSSEMKDDGRDETLTGVFNETLSYTCLYYTLYVIE